MAVLTTIELIQRPDGSLNFRGWMVPALEMACTELAFGVEFVAGSHTRPAALDLDPAGQDLDDG
jgi:hypothetical protein